MIEIMIDLQGGAKAPLYEKIYTYIKNEITIGKMATGEKLPSTRLLAQNLSVSRSTVEMAYEQLLAEGYIKAEPCRGFFVCDVTELYCLGVPVTGQEGQQGENRGKTGAYLGEATGTGHPVWGENRGKTGAYLGRGGLPEAPGWGNAPEHRLAEGDFSSIEIDFSPYAIDTEHFPFNVWRKIHKNVLLDDREELLYAGDGQGEFGLRCAIASYLHQARGVNCEPSDIVVGAGNEYLELLLTQILGGGQKVLMENPTYPQAYHTFCNAGYQMEMLTVGEQGMQVEEVRRRNPDIVYMMPSHQFPLGTVMPLKQRLELLKWAAEGGNRYLIEDDHDSEYRYRGKPIPSLQSVDTVGKVIYLGTFSKSIAPSLRISYMVLPAGLLERYHRCCGFYSVTVPKMQQEVLRAFIEEGHFERHLNKMRGIYRSKHDFLLGELKKRSWVKAIRGEHAGLHVLVEVRTELSEQEICALAGKRGVRVYGISEYFICGEESKGMDKRGHGGTKEGGNGGEETGCPVVVLGYGKLTEAEIRDGLGKLDEVLGKEKLPNSTETSSNSTCLLHFSERIIQ